MKFTVHQTDGEARLGTIETAHGPIETPIFMPVGTRASVKTLTGRQLEEIHAQIILSNTYHLMLRPGLETIDLAGGLHKFMRWRRPILTDSGGFQVFSLADLSRVTEEGVHFRSHIDGSSHFLGPRESMVIQKTLGSDIVMAFDQCSPYPCSYEDAIAHLRRTHAWAEICRSTALQHHQALFAIVQGGVFADLRVQSAKTLSAMAFDGYGIGGLSVGEPAEMMYDMLDSTVAHLPQDKPRYLMGVGTPRNLVEAVMRGIDMFDCVMPTRNARNGQAFTWSGKINVRSACYTNDMSLLDPELDSYASGYSKAYVRHLLNVDEITGLTLVSLQNLAFYLDFMRQLRNAIKNNCIRDFYQRVCIIYPS